MKQTLIYLLVFIFLCIISNHGIDYTIGKQIEKQSPYYLSFASIGANSLESHLDCWAKINTTSSARELNSYLINILHSLNMPADLKNIEVKKNDNATILKYETIHETTKYYFIVESNEANKETYFIINLVADEESKLKGISNQLDKIIGLNWSYYYKYTGHLNMAVDEKSSKELVKVIMKNLDMEQIEETELYLGRNTCSAAGFSKKLAKTAPGIKVNNQDVNVQIAVQSDEYKHQTNIIIGSPLILGEY